MYKILTINPGSTSTKLALFHDMEPVVKDEIFIDSTEVSKFDKIKDQLPMREAMIREFMERQNIKAVDLDIIVARGGSLPPIDRIILTGGGARSQTLVDWIKERVEFLAPVSVVPGEKEMEALAEGGYRVLKGLEKAKVFTGA